MIIDNFKIRHEKILFETLSFEETGVNEILEYEYRMNGIEALRERMAQMEMYYQDKKDETTGVRITLEGAIEAVTASIASTEKTIQETRETIEHKQMRIQAMEQLQERLRKKIDAHKKIILDYVANLYSQGNLVLDESGEVDIFQTLILTEEDTDFHLTDMTYKALASELGQKFIEEYRTSVREYYVHTVQTREEKAGLEALELALKKQLGTLEAQKQERERLLEIAKGEEAMFERYIAQQQEMQEQLEQAWQKAHEDYEASFNRFLAKYNCEETEDEEDAEVGECGRIRKFFHNEVELARSEYATGTENIFSWPVSSRRITTYFRDGAYYNYLRSHHDAIDIGLPQGSPIVAPADGYVYYILEPAPGNYSYIAVKHKNGLVTVYGHLSAVHVEPYQFVREGDIIAESGGAVGTPGAGPMTTGPHLHFEVWKDREPVDPLRYMTLVDIDYTKLPARYQSKFIADMVEQGNDTGDYKIRFALKGETEEERQKYLLNTYATQPFKNWNMWIDSAMSAKVDPSFMMCIGLAETTLGNHLKTPYNIGNIGNTDSGDTISFSSPQEGLAWMAKTFNNKYLGKYTKVSELSRWGNTSGPIYASSSSNWHDNTIRCLSALKGRFVEDDYEFRITDIEQ